MIKIIKEGKKSFITTCPICGCQFAYELRDINMSGSVYCPCCGRSIIHKKQAGGERGSGLTFPLDEIVYTTDTSEE